MDKIIEQDNIEENDNDKLLDLEAGDIEILEEEDMNKLDESWDEKDVVDIDESDYT